MHAADSGNHRIYTEWLKINTASNSLCKIWQRKFTAFVASVSPKQAAVGEQNGLVDFVWIGF